MPLAHWLNAAALTGLRSIFSDVHAAGKNGFDFFLSAELTELCEAIGVRRRQTEKTEALCGSPSLVCGDRLTNVLVSGMMEARNGGVTVAPYLPRYHPNKKAKLNTSFEQNQ